MELLGFVKADLLNPDLLNSSEHSLQGKMMFFSVFSYGRDPAVPHSKACSDRWGSHVGHTSLTRCTAKQLQHALLTNSATRRMVKQGHIKSTAQGPELLHHTTFQKLQVKRTWSHGVTHTACTSQNLPMQLRVSFNACPPRSE